MQKDLCIFHIATSKYKDVKFKKGNICLKIDDEKISYACLVAYATYWKNEKTCSPIINSDGKLYCIANALNNPSYCEQIKNKEIKNKCFKVIMKEKN